MIPIDQITGLILAGGRGFRMGGVDKGLQILHGMPMAQHALRRLSPQVGPITINANRNLDIYATFGVPVRSDEYAAFAGPLAGLQTALQHCDTPYLVATPCDSPCFPIDLVARLSEALEQAAAELAVAATGTGETRRLHPVFCLLKTTLLPHLTNFLREGGRKVECWQASLKMVEVAFADENAFCNINTPDALRRCETANAKRDPD